jgi:hypothetical protein
VKRRVKRFINHYLPEKIMAIPNTNWGEITTTTLFNRQRKIADNVTKNNALLMRLSEKDKIKEFDGGQAIVQEIEYSENGTYKRYSGLIN